MDAVFFDASGVSNARQVRAFLNVARVVLNVVQHTLCIVALFTGVSLWPGDVCVGVVLAEVPEAVRSQEAFKFAEQALRTASKTACS